jgi:hypothetical protein
MLPLGKEGNDFFSVEDQTSEVSRRKTSMDRDDDKARVP